MSLSLWLLQWRTTALERQVDGTRRHAFWRPRAHRLAHTRLPSRVSGVQVFLVRVQAFRMVSQTRRKLAVALAHADDGSLRATFARVGVSRGRCGPNPFLEIAVHILNSLYISRKFSSSASLVDSHLLSYLIL